jgi:hypothetical protein
MNIPNRSFVNQVVSGFFLLMESHRRGLKQWVIGLLEVVICADAALLMEGSISVDRFLSVLPVFRGLRQGYTPRLEILLEPDANTHEPYSTSIAHSLRRRQNFTVMNLNPSPIPPNFPKNTFCGFLRHDFRMGENAVTLIEPRNPKPGRRWVWRAEFFDAFPAFPLEMLERGWWFGYMNVGNTFGCPSAMARFDVFYKEMTEEYGFHKRPVLEGLSRGGLYVYNWAATHPSTVGLVYGDNPVCDFKSWPGGKGQGPGSMTDWAELLQCYGFPSEQEALDWPGNPVDNLTPLVKAGIPLVHVYGDADEVVPWEENTRVMAGRAEALGAKIQLFRKPGCRHHPHGPEDPAVLADWILEHTLDE